MKTTTKYDDLKGKIIAIARHSLYQEQEDIQSGIQEGIYEDNEDNKKRLAEIEYSINLIEDLLSKK